jgi:NAD-dependent DNA ligase
LTQINSPEVILILNTHNKQKVSQEIKIMGVSITDIPGIGPSAAETLKKNGYETLQHIAETTAEKLEAVPGFGMIRATRVIKLANELLTAPVPGTLPPAKNRPGPKRAAPRVAQPSVASGTEKQEPEKPETDKPKKDKSKKDKSKKGKSKKDKSKKDKSKKDKSQKDKKKGKKKGKKK